MSVIIDGKIFNYVSDGNGFKLVQEEGAVGGDVKKKASNVKKNHPEEEEESDEYEDDEDEGDDEDAVPSKRRKVRVAKRCSWTKEEEEKFLRLCLEKRVAQKMSSKYGNVPHTRILRVVCAPLNNAGLGRTPKTPKQCKSKFKKLKMAYFDWVRKNGEGGGPESSGTCNHYELLDRLFGKRASASGVDQPAGPSNNEIEDDVVSLDSASAIDHPATSGSSSSSTTCVDTPKSGYPPRYKSVGTRTRPNPIVNAMKTFMEHSAEEARRQKEWFVQQMEAERKAHSEMMQTISSSFQSGLASLLNVLTNQASTASSTPPSDNVSLADANLATSAVPSQLSKVEPEANSQCTSHTFHSQPLNMQNSTPVSSDVPVVAPVVSQSLVRSPTQSQVILSGTKVIRLPNGKVVLVRKKSNDQSKSS